MNEVDKILNRLVLPHLPFPLSVPEEFAKKSAEKAKDEISRAKTFLARLVKRCKTIDEAVKLFEGGQK